MSKEEDALLQQAGVNPTQSEDQLLEQEGVTDDNDLAGAANPISGTESIARGGEQGLTFGMAPRIHAMVQAEAEAPQHIMAGSKLASYYLQHPDEYVEKSFDDSKAHTGEEKGIKSVDQLYNEYLQLQNKKFNDAQTAHPVLGTIGNVAGGLLLPIPGVGIAAKSGLKTAKYAKAAQAAMEAGEALPNAASYAPMLAKMADSGVTGTGLGSAYGLSNSDDLLDPSKDLQAMGKGALIGGTIGTVAPPVISTIKGLAGGSAEAGRKIFGPLGEIFSHNVQRGQEGLPNLGTEAGRAQDIEMRGELAYGTANDVVQRIKDRAKEMNRLYNMASDEGRQIPPDVVDNWVQKQLELNPQINEKDVLEQLSQLRELIRTAKDGHEVEQITHRFFGEGNTDIAKFKLQGEGDKMVQDLQAGAPVKSPREAFEDQVAQKGAEQEALGASDVGPIETEYIPQDDGKTLAVAKQQTFGEEPPAFIPKKVMSKRIDIDPNTNQPVPDQMQEMQNLLEQKQAEQRATPHQDHNDLELHIEPANIQRIDKGTGTIVPQHVAVIREKAPAQLGGTVETGLKKVASAVLPPNESYGPSEVKTYPTSQPGKVLAVEQRPVLDADGKVLRTEVVRDKVINEENAAKFVTEKNMVREGGRDLSQIDQWQNMLDAVRRKSKWSPEGSGFGNQTSRDAATDAFKSGQQVLDQVVPEAVPVRKDIGSLKNIADMLGIDTYDFENNPSAQNQVGPRLQKIFRDLHNPDDSGFNARKKAEDILGELEKVSPLWAKSLREQMNTFGMSSALSHKLDKPFNALALSGVIRNFSAPVAAGLGHKVGETIAENSPIIQKLAGNVTGMLEKATPEWLQNMATRAQSGGGQMAELGSMFMKAANADERSRNAILFGIMSQPGYRQWIQSNDPDKTSPEIPNG